jgi:phenylacetate-CoA ligase
VEAQELIRNYSFFMLDRLKGGRIAKHYRDISEAYNATQAKCLDAEHSIFLKHAWETTGFYKKYSGVKSLTDYPVINRDYIKGNYKEFLSTVYKKSQVRYAVTSGSTGNPFHYPMTEEKWARRTAEIIFFNELAGFKVGMKHLNIRNKDKSKIGLFFQNAVLLESKVIDEEWLSNARKLILDNKKIKVVISFVSTIELLAHYCSSFGDEPDRFIFNSLILKGEPMYEPTRKLLEDTFSCQVFSRYASEECGVIAQNCPDANLFHVNSSSYFIEILSLNSDEPAKPGEPGRVVITDHNSHVLPLIRYDIGDISVSADDCCCGKKTPVLKYIEGREIDLIFNTKGEYVSPFVINRTLKVSADIKYFQFIQRSQNKYVVNLSVNPDYAEKEMELKLSGELHKVLGTDAVIDIVYLDTIPVSSTGKRNYIINEHSRNQ